MIMVMIVMVMMVIVVVVVMVMILGDNNRPFVDESIRGRPLVLRP